MHSHFPQTIQSGLADVQIEVSPQWVKAFFFRTVDNLSISRQSINHSERAMHLLVWKLSRSIANPLRGTSRGGVPSMAHTVGIILISSYYATT